MSSVIFLVDMNAFFISCEMTRNRHLRGLPAAVAGDPDRRLGIILAANYEARALGVRTAMTVHEALRKCPKIKLVPPDHDFYLEKSEEVMDLLYGFSSIIEPNSIDEAWLDMTGSLQLFGPPLIAARRIMQEIEQQLGLWCSIGISENKFLAKMASSMKKPKGISTLWIDEIQEKMWPLPVDALYGVGRKTAEKLTAYGIRTIGDLAAVDESLLAGWFGKTGRLLSRHARGVDPEPVLPQQSDAAKSIGRSITLPQNLSQFAEAEPILLSLADAVGRTARKNNRIGRTVHVVIKFSDFTIITRQMNILPSNSTRHIYQAGCQLLQRGWPAGQKIRLLGITLSGFETDGGDRQISLFDKIDASASDKRQVAVDQAMDQIRDRFGEKSIKRARQINPGENAD
ncbi:MAG: DNA polymerase IV [Clostridiaceae bacterium]|nr:DNA polymerase IV [Clostridiaceae bacterium]